MFTFIARLLLRNRILILSVLVLLSGFMAYQGQYIKISYKFSRLLPEEDSTQIAYDQFRERFNQVGNRIVLATDSFDLFEPQQYQLWKGLQDSLQQLDGVSSVLSPINVYKLRRNDSLQRLEYYRLPTREEGPALDSLGQSFERLPFYHGLLRSPDGEMPLMLVQVDTNQLYSKNLQGIVSSIQGLVVRAEQRSGRDFKISGLPHIRMANTQKVSRELFVMIGLALAVTALIFLFFLRSFMATLISLSVVLLGVFWSFGLISLFGYAISMLSSLVPTLVIVIGVPNCIFLINKFHIEYRNHGNRVLALSRVIRKIGAATFLTNATTAMGFAALILTDSVVLKEFGVIASINIMMVFLISLILIPVLYSFKKAPKLRHYQHFDKRWISGFIQFLVRTVMYHRRRVYLVALILMGVALAGVAQIYTSGNLSEEFQESDPLYQDLKYYESKMGGVVPLELVIDTRRPGGAYRSSTLKRLDALQEELAEEPMLSRSLSIADGIKFAKQGFYRGDPEFYELPTSQERSFIFSYLPDDEGAGKSSLLSALVDSSGRYARVTMQVHDLGKNESEELKAQIYSSLEQHFPAERYHTKVTGSWMVFQKGTTYLIRNLFLSLGLAILVIAIVMAILFRSISMVAVSLIPNLFPLLLTAGIMGYFAIPLKPSTILVFSVAFGISVDDTIHFLAKYRQELKTTGYNIGQSVLRAVRETGVSMFYTSIVLFFGFGVFTASSFGGIVALGILVSITLVLAMLANLLLLPSLLLSFERHIISKNFTDSYISIYEEDQEEPAENVSPGGASSEQERGSSSKARL